MKQDTQKKLRIAVGITGASGIVYGVRLLEALGQADVKTYLVMSRWAEENLFYEETGKTLEEVKALAHECYGSQDMAAPIASGSFPMDGMVVAPCSMKSLAAIAHGYSDSLLVRAADVMLKERRRLILVPRETPLSLIHLRNMTEAAQAGAVIMPPMPAFYHRPRTVEDIICHTVARVLDLLGVENSLIKRWGT